MRCAPHGARLVRAGTVASDRGRALPDVRTPGAGALRRATARLGPPARRSAPGGCGYVTTTAEVTGWVRPPAVADLFYAADPDRLRDDVVRHDQDGDSPRPVTTTRVRT